MRENAGLKLLAGVLAAAVLMGIIFLPLVVAVVRGWWQMVKDAWRDEL